VSLRGRLAILLGLIGATAVAIGLAPEVREGQWGAGLDALPTEVAGWTSTAGAPEWALPVDPNEKAVLRRTYRRAGQVVWVSIALFAREDDPKRRSSIDRIFPEANTSRIDRVAIPVSLNGAAPMRLPAVVGYKQGGPLAVVYWRQLGRRVYGDDYRYRLALMREVLFRRQAGAMLVRLAIQGESGGALEDALSVASEIAPPLYAALAPVTTSSRAARGHQ
jgi:EpsI family protein